LYQSVPIPNFDGRKQRKILAIPPENSKTIELIFSLVISDESYGMKRIASYLNDKKIFKNNHKWSNNDVHRLVSDPIYYGESEYGHNRVRRDLHNEIIIIPTPAIISKKDFMLVKNIMEERAPSKSNTENKGIQSPSLLMGRLKYGACGYSLVINTGKSGQYAYYKCRDKIVCSVKVCNCQIPEKNNLKKL